MLAALSVFRGGWRLEEAERVCDADVELLQSLVDKSLVRRWESGRLGMLETIREFAAERLRPGDRDELVRRLLEVLTEMYWGTNDPLGGRQRVSALLEDARAEIDPDMYAGALRLRGSTYDMTGDNARAEPEYERAIEVFRSLGEEEEADHLMHRLAHAAQHQGDIERAIRIASEALELDRRRGNRRDEAVALNTLAMCAFAQGDPERGVRLAHKAASVAESVGFMWWRGVTLLGAAEHLIAAGDPEPAQRDFLDGLETIVSVRDRVNLPIALAAGAAIAAAQGHAERAGMLWGSVETAADREPRPTTAQGLREYRPYVEPVQGREFESGRPRGRGLSLEEAARYALSGETESGD